MKCHYDKDGKVDKQVRCKDVPGYEDRYCIYENGTVYSKKANKNMTLQMGNNGYWYVKLRKKGKREHRTIHRLLAMAFIPNPGNKPEVNHIDSDRSNYALENLEWVTTSENQKHSYKHTNRMPNKTMIGKFGKLHPRSVVVEQYTLTGKFLTSYYGYCDAGRKTGIQYRNIHKACNGQRKTAGGYVWKLATVDDLD